MYVVVKDRTCRQCGRVFAGGPRAWYCPDCRRERQLESQRRSNRRQRAGMSRKLGGIELCPICGKEMVIRSANQKYCPDCSPKMVRAIDSRQSRDYARAVRSTSEGRERLNAAKRAARKKHTIAGRVCIVCGAVFVPSRTTQRVCSDECRRKARRYREQMSEWRHGRRKSEPAPLPFTPKQ